MYLVKFHVSTLAETWKVEIPPNQSCLQNNPPKNNAEPVPAKYELPLKQSAGK
jgi:hypothetical protein